MIPRSRGLKNSSGSRQKSGTMLMRFPGWSEWTFRVYLTKDESQTKSTSAHACPYHPWWAHQCLYQREDTRKKEFSVYVCNSVILGWLFSFCLFIRFLNSGHFSSQILGSARNLIVVSLLLRFQVPVAMLHGWCDLERFPSSLLNLCLTSETTLLITAVTLSL